MLDQLPVLLGRARATARRVGSQQVRKGRLTVRSPSSVPARKTRMAISPRLAHSTCGVRWRRGSPLRRSIREAFLA
jgi:hypothetical protein